jgi:hypothetical protein
MLTAEDREHLRELITQRIGGLAFVECGLSLSYHAGTDIGLEVLFDAALNGGRLDWKAVIPHIDVQGPLIVLARTKKGYVIPMMMMMMMMMTVFLLSLFSFLSLSLVARH